jgi:hypothetical protein
LLDFLAGCGGGLLGFGGLVDFGGAVMHFLTYRKVGNFYKY